LESSKKVLNLSGVINSICSKHGKITEGKMMKRIFPTLISTALVLSAFSQLQASAGTKALTSQLSLQHRASAVRFVPRQTKETNRKQHLTITAKYPQAMGNDPRFERMNHAIKSMVDEDIANFKKEFQSPDQRMGDSGSYYDSGYLVKLATNDVVSIYFNAESFNEGAAHPNHASMVFNYSFETGKTLTLAELFKGNNYLKVISSYAIRSLKKQLAPNPDMEWIQRGAGPEEENYKNWNITARGLLITFDQYQVASYADGPHEVLIPYSALKNIVDPQGPLAKVAK
jgi:Protein of unknown function (DUF3298)/Deacetylase PdaC